MRLNSLGISFLFLLPNESNLHWYSCATNFILSPSIVLILTALRFMQSTTRLELSLVPACHEIDRS